MAYIKEYPKDLMNKKCCHRHTKNDHNLEQEPHKHGSDGTSN